MDLLTQDLQSWLAPGPESAPNCIICSRPTTSFTTRGSNRKGNAGRPYFKCRPCGKFHCFADERGNDPRNPLCSCGVSSKTQVTGLNGRAVRGMHYVCRLGRCAYYGVPLDEQDRQVTVPEGLVDAFARMFII